MRSPRPTAIRLHGVPLRCSPLALLTAAILWTVSGASASAQAPRPRWTSDTHRFEVYSVAFSPDGKILASAGGYFSSDLKPGEIDLRDVATGKPLRSLKGHAGGVWSVAFSPDGKTLASASADRTVKLWDAATGEEKGSLEGHGVWVRSVAFSPDGKTLASASNDKTVKLWDVASRKEPATLRGHTEPVACLAIGLDGRTLASVAFDDTLRVWDMESGKEERRLPIKKASYAMAFSPDGKTLAVSGVGGVELWDAGNWRLRTILKPTSPSSVAVAFSTDGKTLATTCADRAVSLMDVKDGRVLADLPHGNVVLCVAFSPDGKALASGTGATAPFRVNLWDVDGGLGRAEKKE